MNYDAVGYATIGAGGNTVTGAHHTLPLPSYVEVTSLDSGRTILVRLVRRGPMDGTGLIELSPGAAAQLGLSTGAPAPVRVRRVNPPEFERAMLRAGGRAPARMSTPASLLAVLRRKLAPDTVELAQAPPHEDARPAPAPGPAPSATPFSPAEAKHATPARQPAPLPVARITPPAAIDPAAHPAPRPHVASTTPISRVAPSNAAPAPRPTAPSGDLVVQTGAFAVKANAAAVAAKLGASLSRAGRLWRVRMGPFAARAEAEAALAKARAAGYSQARILRAD